MSKKILLDITRRIFKDSEEKGRGNGISSYEEREYSLLYWRGQYSLMGNLKPGWDSGTTRSSFCLVATHTEVSNNDDYCVETEETQLISI